MENKRYEQPEMKIAKLSLQDVIATSNHGTLNEYELPVDQA